MASIAFASIGKLIELLNTATASKDAFVRVLSKNRLALGVDPFHPSYIIDISREVLVPCHPDEPNNIGNVYAAPGPLTARSKRTSSPQQSHNI